MKLTADYIKSIFPKRSIDSHKGDYGHTLIIAGSKQFTGAAVLCSMGCLRAGSGLTSLAISESLYIPITKRLLPEIITITLPDKNYSISEKATKILLDYIIERKISSIAFGCGISREPHTKIFTERFLIKNKIPIVIDADGLNNIQKNVKILKNMKAKKIITPHPAELSRLTKISITDIQKNREKIALKFAKDYKLICVLKGYETVISDGEKIYLNTTGNPGMAVAGSGDVLTGMIAGLIGQTENLLDAACLGVYLHGLAGDLAAKEKTEISMLPTDLIEKIPDAIKNNGDGSI
ncbi:MAG: NAD(P)H-hydrate dehydratase [Elusimicrobia bacterium RIFOXYD2_FULL_34_30]|nr:MAG: NAD(P)H-hydrate dehydratase [Elusimicrobia bacterium RIFOXYD2_FULL_34_30]